MSDYMYRGNVMESFSFLDFLLESYEPGQFVYNEDTYRHERVPYLTASDLHRDRHRVFRHPHSEMIPDFLGSWIPRNDRPEQFDFYCASVMLLLKPWRNLDDLKLGFNSWTNAFSQFLLEAKPRVQRIIDNFQFFYQSSDAATRKKLDEANHLSIHDITSFANENDDVLTSVAGAIHVPPTSKTHLNYDQIAEYYENSGEAYHGLQALDIADDIGIFKDGDDKWRASFTNISNASVQLLTNNFSWQVLLKKHTKDLESFGTVDAPTNALSTVTTLPNLPSFTSTSVVQPLHETPTRSVFLNDILNGLTADQLRACKIVQRHLDVHLSGISQNPLRMLICGSGGVGKSTVIRTIQKLFLFHSSSNLLATTATSGVAASNINGYTIHWWAGLPIVTPRTPNFVQKSSPSIKDRCNINISACRYLIIDEVSMLCQEILGLLTAVLSEYSQDKHCDDPFGNSISIILIGDFHQFPPTARTNLALFKEPGTSPWARVGHSAFQLFETVVILTEQKRIVDPIWSGVLERVRYGQCSADDVNEIQKLALRPQNCEIPDFNSEPWLNTILVTPRHSVRRRWNISAVKKFARLNKTVLLISHAQHSYHKGRLLEPSTDSDELFVIAREDKRLGKILPRKVYLAVGLRVLLTFNIRVSADLANGTSGIITDIFLDPREPAISSEHCVHDLIYPPKLIFFRPDHCNLPALPHLPQGILPIIPSTSQFKITTSNGVSTTIDRTQYPIEAAYSLTDYKAQGSTIAPVILDLRSPPSSNLTQFNLYVAMSRGVSRDLTRILTPPKISLLTTPPDKDLVLFDTKLNHCNQITQDLYRLLYN